MKKVYILETKITDHPDYECFVGVYGDKEDAIAEARKRLVEECEDMGDDPTTEIHTMLCGADNVRIEYTESVYFVTGYEVK